MGYLNHLSSMIASWQVYQPISGAKLCLQRYQDLDTALTSVPWGFKMMAFGVGGFFFDPWEVGMVG